MSHKLSWLAAALASGVLGFGMLAPAHADTIFNWSWADGTNSGSGTLTTGPNPNNAGGFDITSMMGTWDGLTITLDAPNTFLLNPNDNLLYPGGTLNGMGQHSTFVLDFSGVAFMDSNGDQINIRALVSVLAYGAEVQFATGGGSGNEGNFTISVPGPIAGAGLPGLILAGGGLLALARRRRRQLVA